MVVDNSAGDEPGRASGEPLTVAPDSTRSWSNFANTVVFMLSVSVVIASSWLLVWLVIGRTTSVWAVDSLDATVVWFLGLTLIGGLVWASFVAVWPERAPSRPWATRILTVLGVLGVLFTLYVSYASFRNQSRLTAESELNEEAMQLYGIEMEDPAIRCLYDNYGYNREGECLETLVSTEANWSKGILYAEETWFVLEKAHTDKQLWGSGYADSIRFWAEDVQKDPTGLFSYYLVSSADSWEAAAALNESSGVRIPRPCEGFRRVLEALDRHDARPRKLSTCAQACLDNPHL